MAQLPPQLQDKLMKLQQLQQRAELLMNQRVQLDRDLKETESALAELDQLGDENPVVYKSVGAILVKADKDKLKEELSDHKETLDMRISSISKQEERARKELEEKRKEIQAALQQPQMGGMGGGFPGPM